MNLVHLASVNTWSHHYLRHMYKAKYEKHAEQVQLYQEATAWYDALDALYVEDRDANPMIEKLMGMESAYWIKTCKTCEVQDLYAVYQSHANYCGLDDDVFYDCEWCDLVRRCWDCRNDDWSGFAYCTKHWQVANNIRSKQPRPCTCRFERDYSDEHFMRKVYEYGPYLADLGWLFVMSVDNKLQIIPPSERTDQLTWSEELACQYFGE